MLVIRTYVLTHSLGTTDQKQLSSIIAYQWFQNTLTWGEDFKGEKNFQKKSHAIRKIHESKPSACNRRLVGLQSELAHVCHALGKIK